MFRVVPALLLIWIGLFGLPGEVAAQGAMARVYELRTYTTHPDRLDELIQRFEDHTVRLFEKHGIESVGYWVPQDDPASENTLIYMLAHRNRDAAMANWAAFSEDPEWQAVRAASESDGPIVENVVRVFMDPTSFSGLR
jgi:hypothetical protein